MEKQEFIYSIFIGVPVLVAFISPILKLNSNIVKLNATIEGQTKDIVTQENRINGHSKEIDVLKIDVARHDTRLDNLEQRSCKYEESKRYKGEWHE